MTVLAGLGELAFGGLVVTVGLACFWPGILGERLGPLHRWFVFALDNALHTDGPHPPRGAVLWKGTAVTFRGVVVICRGLITIL